MTLEDIFLLIDQQSPSDPLSSKMRKAVVMCEENDVECTFDEPSINMQEIIESLDEYETAISYVSVYFIEAWETLHLEYLQQREIDFKQSSIIVNTYKALQKIGNHKQINNYTDLLFRNGDIIIGKEVINQLIMSQENDEPN